MSRALLELAYAKHPSDIQDPKARAALLACTRVLRDRLPAGLFPFPHQLVPIAFAHLAGDRALLGDEMGIGKTMEAVGRIVIARAFPTVVITTASAMGAWEDTLKQWVPDVPLWVLNSAPKDEDAVRLSRFRGLILASWGLLTRLEPMLVACKPQLLVVDEAHYAKNEDTIRTGVLTRLAATCPRLLLITGTPIENSAVELWRLLRLLDPRAWPAEDPFEALDAAVADAKGALDAVATRNDPLQRKIRQFMVRRLKADVMPELQAKGYEEIPVVLNTTQRAEYQSLEKDFRAWLARQTAARAASGNAKKRASAETKGSRSQQAEFLARTQALRLFVGLAKIQPALVWIRRMVRAGEPVLLFVEHQDVLNGITKGLTEERIPFGRIDGATPKDVRKATMRSFQGGQLNVLVASRAAKEGVTLTRAAHVCQVERWWTPTGEDQGADRLHRATQKRKVTVWRIHVLETIDVRMVEILSNKRTIVEHVVGGTKGG